MAPRAACARPSAGAPTRERARPGVLPARLGPWALPAVIAENKVSGACPDLSHTNVTTEQEALLELGHVRKTRDYFLLWSYGGWGGLEQRVPASSSGQMASSFYFTSPTHPPLFLWCPVTGQAPCCSGCLGLSCGCGPAHKGWVLRYGVESAPRTGSRFRLKPGQPVPAPRHAFPMEGAGRMGNPGLCSGPERSLGVTWPTLCDLSSMVRMLHRDRCTRAFVTALENAWVLSPHQDGRSCAGRGVLRSLSACWFLAVSTGHNCCPVDPQGSEAVPVLTLVTPWDKGHDSTRQSS